MKKIETKEGGSKIVVWDQVDSTYVGGVHVDADSASARFEDGVIPAGTAILLADPDEPATVAVEGTDEGEGSLDSVDNLIGLTEEDVEIDDYPLVTVVQAGTARKEALPDLEQASLENIQEKAPRITFY